MGTFVESAIPTEKRTAGATISWEDSDLRQFYNNRIFNSLPAILQSAMSPTAVHYRAAGWTAGTSN